LDNIQRQIVTFRGKELETVYTGPQIAFVRICKEREGAGVSFDFLQMTDLLQARDES